MHNVPLFLRLCSTGTRSRRNSVESKVDDIDGWLRADVQESDAASSDSSMLTFFLSIANFLKLLLMAFFVVRFEKMH